MSKTVFNFAKPVARYDMARANDGITKAVYDENKTYYGHWTFGLQDDANPRVRVNKERYDRVHSERTEGFTRLEKIVDIFVELYLKGWDGILDADGKKMPYSKEAAKAYLNHPDFYIVMEQLWPWSHDVKLFQSPDVKSKDEETGN